MTDNDENRPAAGQGEPGESELAAGSGATGATNSSAMEENHPELPILKRFSSSEAMEAARPSRKRVHLAVLFVTAMIFLPNAGSFGLWDPWETHYGEVTRNMIETGDWVSPWWGFRDKIGTEPIAGKPFFSKPVFTFWIEAVSVKIFGLSEWAIRLPFALIAMSAVFCVYLTMASLFSTGAGVLSALVMATSPQFFFIGRQAQTDMPFVGTMSMALCLLIVAFFGRRRRISDRQFYGVVGGTLGLLLLCTLPQYGILLSDLEPGTPPSRLSGISRWWFLARGSGLFHVAVYAVLLGGVILSVILPIRRKAREGLDEAFKDAWVRRCELFLAYALFAAATMAKGLLGFMLPGAILFVFLLLSGRWKLLLRCELLRGILIFICVGFPWYMAMFARHGMKYYTRFFIHDHFNRIGSGVHQIDSGTFEHFIKWLSYGMFPWVVFIPFVLLAFARFRAKRSGRDNLLLLLLFLWFFIAYSLFTLSSTKFHHYIFPALIPMAMMVGLYLDRLRRAAASKVRLVVVLGFGILAAISWDLMEDPQNLRNLFTYKYDRPMPDHMPTDVNGLIASDSSVTWGESGFYEHTNAVVLNALNSEVLHFENFLQLLCGLMLLTLACFAFFSRARTALLGVFGGLSVVMAVYCLNVYMPMFSAHWSQKYVFERYYEDCTPVVQTEEIEEAYTPLLAKIGLGGLADAMGAKPKRVCKEDVISWLITWRGETYYGYNEVRPINKEASQFEAYLRDMNGGKTFYILMERGKDKAFGKKLNNTYLKNLKEEPDFRDIARFDVEKIHNENRYFILVKATAVKADAAEKAGS